MASQREWESVVWHFLGDYLKHTNNEDIKDWIYDFPPSTKTQDERWESAVSKVYYQIQKFADDEKCEKEECVGYYSEAEKSIMERQKKLMGESYGS